MLVKEFPPQGEPKIDQPRIYFGEITNDYVIVKTQQDEFDYAQEGSDARTVFSGTGGVSVGTLWGPLLFSGRFRDSNLLFTNQATIDSKGLFHRNPAERRRLIAPLLPYDPHPTLVVPP